MTVTINLLFLFIAALVGAVIGWIVAVIVYTMAAATIGWMDREQATVKPSWYEYEGGEGTRSGYPHYRRR